MSIETLARSGEERVGSRGGQAEARAPRCCLCGEACPERAARSHLDSRLVTLRRTSPRSVSQSGVVPGSRSSLAWSACHREHWTAPADPPPPLPWQHDLGSAVRIRSAGSLQQNRRGAVDRRRARPPPRPANRGGGILRHGSCSPSNCRDSAGASKNSSATYLAVHDVLCRVTAIRELRAVEAPSSCRPRAQVTGGCEERMGEPRNAEDLRGRPDKA